MNLFSDPALFNPSTAHLDRAPGDFHIGDKVRVTRSAPELSFTEAFGDSWAPPMDQCVGQTLLVIGVGTGHPEGAPRVQLETGESPWGDYWFPPSVLELVEARDEPVQ